METPRYPLVERPAVEAARDAGFTEAINAALQARRERHLEALEQHPLGGIVT